MKKILVAGIIALFVGSGIFPSTVGIIDNNNVGLNLKSGGYIQGLIDNASAGDTIYIPSGIYYESIIIDKSISLVGEDKNTTIIDANFSGDVVYISSDWVNISGFTIRNSGNEWVPTDAGIDIHSNYNSITDNIISNSPRGVYISQSLNNDIKANNLFAGSTIFLDEHSESNNVTGNNIYEGRIILTDHSVMNTITDNTISNGSSDGIYLSDQSNSNIIKNNIITSNNFDGIRLGGYSRFNIVTGNHINSNNRSGIYLDSNNNTIIDNTFFNNGLFVDSHYNTIENNTINGKPLVYLEDESNKVIDSMAGQVILVNCDNIIVENQNISDIGIVGSASIAIGLLGTNNTKIRNNNCSNNMYGIYHKDSHFNTIIGNTISNNSRGIFQFDDSSSNTITNNNIKDNLYGILLDHSPDNNISGNIISGGGIAITQDSHKNTITNNTLNGSSIYIDYSDFNIVNDNKILNSGIGLFSSDFNIIKSNNITSCQGAGISLSSSHSNAIKGNAITDNEFGIILGESRNIITGNIILDNEYGIKVGGSFNVIIKNNFRNNGQHAYFDTAIRNHWLLNYWEGDIIPPVRITGVQSYYMRDKWGHIIWEIHIPWVNFDWLPRKEPYDIGG